ncbi:MAG TPA: hypothetical protein VGO87_00820, partial [Acidimicrobiia bacterium]
MMHLHRRPRLLGVLAAVALALAPALPSIGIGAQAATGPTRGYWFVAADGGIFSYGDAKFAGSTGNLRLNQPIVGMTPTPTGFGYWFVAADGGIFSFGDAAFYGSTGAIHLAKPIVGMAATPSGHGYWFVASDGGIFNFGDAAFYGSAAAANLRSPIVGMVASPTGRGYYLVAADGAVHSFGDAVFRGSMGGKVLSSPITGLALTSTGAGYWLVAADGGIFSFGDAAFYGSAGNLRLNRAIVGMAAAPQKTTPLPLQPPSGPGSPNPGGTPGTTAPGTPGTTAPGTTPTTLPPANGVDWGTAGTTSVVARSFPGASGGAFRPWMSADGRYLVFDSDAKRIMGGTPDTTAQRDVYLYDRVTGGMERISVASDGSRAQIPSGCAGTQPCGSQRPTISADGRYVAFWSNATNFDPSAADGTANAYVHDRQTGQTILVSKGFSGATPNGESRRPVVSRDGRSVVFESAASNLIAPQTCGLLGLGCKGGDNNKADDVFVYDMNAQTVTMVSTAADGTQGNGASDRPSLNGDGTKIVFSSKATNLVSPATNGQQQVFLKDLTTGATTLVSSDANGVQGDKNSDSPSMSADGRWVSFDSKATSFNPADAGGDTDIYVKDLSNGALDQASVQTGGGQATGTNGSSTVGGDSTISADGRFVAFWSDASTLVPGDTNGSNCQNASVGCADVFVRDRVAGTTTRVTSTNGVQGDGSSFSPALSMDGRFVALDSKANALDPAAGT